jgi:lysophospholipase L1-like esterase
LSSKLSALALTMMVAVFVPVGTALAKKHHHKPKPSYYLALGDSLARGAQPNASGTTLPTSQGYANDLFATEKKKVKGLKLEQLGCLGETTTTMTNGGICHYAAGNQLAQAISFIHKHKISLVTLDIGANDIDNCVVNGSIDLVCVSNGVATIQMNVPKIVQALRSAAGSKVKIVGMTYYDPFLAEFLTGPAGQGVAAASVTLAQQVNGDLTNDYTAGKFKVADVATAFGTYIPFSTMSTLPGHGTVPTAVADICTLTWMCAAPPQGPNIHANVAGYKLIAKTMAALL